MGFLQPAIAGTTGSIAGTVVDSATQKPVAGAQVTASSPSQFAKAIADVSGHFAFISLAPDTYTLTVDATGTTAATTLNGVTVQADQALQTTLQAPERLKQIGRVASRAATLVKPGTTSDVYSVTAIEQDKASQIGGGGTLNSAWSAITTVPGVYVAPSQQGYFGNVSIRGGDFDQIGYELDGVPITRSFDNYPANTLPSLGQQELQVYTGATSATSEASGLSGYINQVIKTGTFPAYRSLTVGDGGPAFYHKLAFEAGGANPARTFSYYVGLGGYNQAFRYGDQFNGAGLTNLYGTPLNTCASVPAANLTPAIVPSCFTANGVPYNTSTPSYVLGAFNLDTTSFTQQRDSIVNLHFGIPRKNGGKDDIQLLFDNNHLVNNGYTSPNDQGGYPYLDAIGIGGSGYSYNDGYQTTTPYGTLLAPGYAGGGGVVSPYYFPFSSAQRAANAIIPANLQDQYVNDQSVVKLQYQHNFGSTAFLRLYGYTYYSDWLQNGPNSALGFYNSFINSDYELNSHTRGLSGLFSAQLSDRHLLSIESSYTTATSTRYNNSGIGFGTGTTLGYLVSGANPYNGTCYSIDGVAVPGCGYNADGNSFQKLTIGDALNGTAAIPAAGVTCGGAACQYAIVSGGASATYNHVRPKFFAFSVTDDFRPNRKLDVNLGLRYDLFQFQGDNTFNSPARTLFYNAYNSQAVANGVTPLAFDPTGAGNLNSYPEIQPRLGFTYAFNPATVFRASYGRYAEAPQTAFEQYNYLQPNDLNKLIGFGQNGLATTPGHDVRPAVSNNYDFSIERQVGRDYAVKVTPFLRKTQDQIQNFYLDQQTNFVSGLNVGRQTSEGIEAEIDKGDFTRNGFSGKLAFTYTNSYINYTKTPSGTSVVDPINAAIAQFNKYTSVGGGFPYYSLADANTGTPGVGSAVGGAGYVANPYYNAPLQALLGENDPYPTFSTFPGGIGTSASTYGMPYVATLLVQYKHGPFSVTPSIQFNAGQRYGTPENTPGIAPDQVTGVLAGSTAADPRYSPYGSPGPNGAPYDATTTLKTIPIPDLATGKFDALGAFIQPSFLQLNMQLAYDVSKRVSIVGTFTNLYTRYFGGCPCQTAFSVPGAQSYTTTAGAGGGIQPVGNVYNPGGPLQPFLATPYNPVFSGTPFGVFVEARFKL